MRSVILGENLFTENGKIERRLQSFQALNKKGHMLFTTHYYILKWEVFRTQYIL